jgi:hypothetical protein
MTTNHEDQVAKEAALREKLRIAVEAIRYAQRETLSAALSNKMLEALEEIEKVGE